MESKGKQLDPDEVYKSRWRKSDFGMGAVQDSLSLIRDRKWVVDECLQRVSTTAEATSALISYGLFQTEPYRSEVNEVQHESEKTYYLLKRLRLLQYKDRLETFLGMNMGRFSPKEYMIFRSTNLQKVAISFAEGGKTAALELLLKRHAYTLAPYVLSILDAIPETLSPHAFTQLLPELSPPKAFLPRRGQDWVENTHVLQPILESSVVPLNDDVSLYDCTEYLVKLFKGLCWPKEDEITAWYLRRARTIDQVSGQLENSLFLLDAGLQKGIRGLNVLWKDVSDLYRFSFSNSNSKEDEAELSLSVWESLDAYDKFKVMLRGVNEDSIVDRLIEVAVPFMRKQALTQPDAKVKKNSFLTRYLEEMSSTHNLRICCVVLEEACKPQYKGVLFQDEADTVEASLSCIYAATEADKWELMTSILSKLPRKETKEQGTEDVVIKKRGFVSAYRYPGGRTSDTAPPRAPTEVKVDCVISDKLENRIKQAEDYVQAGQLLFEYQVPRPLSFFLSCHQDVNGTKQIVRILLSKFSRKQPGRSDGEWAVLWRDLRILQGKVFTFLEKEYILFEFCRGLLKAGKFSLARNYFKGTGTVVLSSEKIENLVIQTGREYFYSASSLESPDIDRAKQCLALIPASMAANAELNIIVAITEKLPRLGVSLLPAQFRQIKNPMEVVQMAISSQKGSFHPVEELLEVARLLGLSCADDMAVVEEAIAREAAAYGDSGLAQDLCLGLAKKGHGKIWDLCAAIGKGPESERLDLHSRKELLGFALWHCDEESIGELLASWKEFDLIQQCAELAEAAGMPVVHLSAVESFTEVLAKEATSEGFRTIRNGQGQVRIETGKRALLGASSNHALYDGDWDEFGKDRKKLLAFACLQLPWLLEFGSDRSGEDLSVDCTTSPSKAAALIMYGLAIHGIVPCDDLLLRLAEEVLKLEDDYLLGCGYLLNLADARTGAEFLRKELEKQKDRDEQRRILEVAVLFSTLQEALLSVGRPEERREILFSAIRGQHFPVTDDPASGFWTGYREAVEEKLQLLDQTKLLKMMMPAIEIERLFAGDLEYINDSVTSMITSMKLNKVLDVEQLAKMLDELQAVVPKDIEARETSFASVYIAFVNEAIKSCQYEHCGKDSSEPVMEAGSHLYLGCLEARYSICKKYFRFISPNGLKGFLGTFFRSSLSIFEGREQEGTDEKPNSNEAAFISYLLRLWIEAMNDVSGDIDPEILGATPEIAKAFLRLIEGKLVTHSEGLDVMCAADGLTELSLTPRKFVTVLVSAGCSFKAALAFLRYVGSCNTDTESSTTHDLTGIYLEVLDMSIEQLKDAGNSRSVLNVLTSAGLRNQEANLEEAESKILETIQHEVWSKLWMFSRHANVPPQTRICLFEILESITYKSFSTDERLEYRTNLAALKSSEIILEEFEGGQITAGDLSTVEAASYCFAGFAERTLSKKQALALKSLLDEWEVIFPAEKKHEDSVQEDNDSWEVKGDVDEWGDGWQEFDVAEVKQTNSVIHKLHACWKVAFLKLVEYRGVEVALHVLDKWSSSSCLLLTEDETRQLIDCTAQENPLSALKLALLLPYEASRSACLSLVEDKVKRKVVVLDSAVLVLVLSTGLLSSIAGDSNLSGLFSALCNAVGTLAYRSQAGLLLPEDSLGSPSLHVAVPYFIAELTRGRHYGVGGSLILQFMRVPLAFATWNASHLALRRYLEVQQLQFRQRRESFDSRRLSESSLSYIPESLNHLVSTFDTVLTEALSLLLRDMK